MLGLWAKSLLTTVDLAAFTMNTSVQKVPSVELKSKFHWLPSRYFSKPLLSHRRFRLCIEAGDPDYDKVK